MGNIKKAWKDAKGMQTCSGWGVKSEDNEQSINDILERKYPFFWCLEEIWGSRPNVSVILHTESIAPFLSTQEPSSQIPPEPTEIPLEPISLILTEPISLMPSEPISPIPSEPISRIPSEPISRIPTPARNSTPASPLPKRSEKHDISAILKRAFEDKQAAQ
ncbi:hypothetical protein BGX38DRAFT_1266988 [Terfezia claveryi]|nr:hypothetical protein BGX38DRAFT_1266988 [Terfezia claveryi]